MGLADWPYSTLDSVMFWRNRPKIHLVGIGGSGMSGIAEVLLSLKFQVSGSDIHFSSTTERLEKMGARIYQGHHEKNLGDATCVVISSAVSTENPEVLSAKKLRIPVIRRAEMLAELMRLKQGIAIAGSHGKTTTTSMAGQFLKDLDPTVVVGGRLKHWNASSIVGEGSHFIIEADESDRSFLHFSPVYSVVTNVDREHLDTYQDFEDLKNIFLEFLNRTAFFGLNWIGIDCPHLLQMRSKIEKPFQTFGFHQESDLRILNPQFSEESSSFALQFRGADLGRFSIPVVGIHNIKNATAVVGLALSLGLDLEKVKLLMNSFVPADRRLQIHVRDRDWVVVEDYGHHPTEIRATLEALRLMFLERDIVCIFQPHRFSRTKSLFHDFAPAFDGLAQKVFMLPIYSAHEKAIEGVSSESLAETFKSLEVKVLSSIPDPNEFLDQISEDRVRPGIVLVLGAGPLTSFAQALSFAVQARS